MLTQESSHPRQRTTGTYDRSVHTQVCYHGSIHARHHENSVVSTLQSVRPQECAHPNLSPQQCTHLNLQECKQRLWEPGNVLTSGLCIPSCVHPHLCDIRNTQASCCDKSICVTQWCLHPQVCAQEGPALPRPSLTLGVPLSTCLALSVDILVW